MRGEIEGRRRGREKKRARGVAGRSRAPGGARLLRRGGGAMRYDQREMREIREEEGEERGEGILQG